MLIGLISGKHSIQKYYNYNHKHQDTFLRYIFKIHFVTLKGVCQCVYTLFVMRIEHFSLFNCMYVFKQL